MKISGDSEEGLLRASDEDTKKGGSDEDTRREGGMQTQAGPAENLRRAR